MQKKFGCHPSSLAFPHSSRSWLLAIHLSNPPVQDGVMYDIRSSLMPLYQGSWMSILREGEWKVIACGFSTMESALPKDICSQDAWRGSQDLLNSYWLSEVRSVSVKFVPNHLQYFVLRHGEPDRFDLVSSQGELNCLDRDFLGPYFVLHQLLCLAGFANPFTGTLAGNGLELTESTDHLQSLRKLFKEVQAELQLNLPVNRLKKDMNNQTINECIDLQKSYTSENI
ncbi:hypothetical protein D5086_030350 [Populus alba]|uniref:Uncharacterized protein n=1 Tax=Populus alba TaxID=43335 RepID=A0ACC4AN97_POPAL